MLNMNIMDFTFLVWLRFLFLMYHIIKRFQKLTSIWFLDTEVVCRQLGYVSAATWTSGSYFGNTGEGTFIASNLHCSGFEDKLDQCSLTWYPTNCSPGEFAGVICSYDEPKGHGK